MFLFQLVVWKRPLRRWILCSKIHCWTADAQHRRSEDLEKSKFTRVAEGIFTRVAERNAYTLVKLIFRHSRKFETWTVFSPSSVEWTVLKMIKNALFSVYVANFILRAGYRPNRKQRQQQMLQQQQQQHQPVAIVTTPAAAAQCAAATSSISDQIGSNASSSSNNSHLLNKKFFIKNFFIKNFFIKNLLSFIEISIAHINPPIHIYVCNTKQYLSKVN